MKKLTYVLAFVLPAAMLFSVVDASAQRRNTTSHDVKPAAAYQADSTQPNMPEMMKRHHDKKMMRSGFIGDAGYDCGCNKENCKKNGCKNSKKAMGDCMKKKCGRWADKQINDINEEYAKAMKKIRQSSLNQSQKNLLTSQAQENRELAFKYAKERADLRQKHLQARIDAGFGGMMQEKANRKAVKKVMEID